MEFNQLIELQEKYATCPKRESNRIKDGKMSALNNRFQRACKCGYSVEVLVTEDGIVEKEEIQEPINIEISALLDISVKPNFN